MRSGSTLVTDTIGVLSPRPTMPRRRDIKRACGAPELMDRQYLGVAGALGVQRVARELALRVPRCRDRRGAVQIQALADERTNGGDLGQQNAGCRDRGAGQLSGRRQRFLGGQRADPFHGFEADRPHDDQFASHGLEQEFGLGHDLAQFGLDAGGADQFFEVLQPRRALAAECDGVGLPGVQPVDERVRGGMALPGRVIESVDTRCCSLIVTSCYLPRYRLARIARRLWRLCLLEKLRWPALPCGGHAIQRRIPTGSFGPADTPAVLRVS